MELVKWPFGEALLPLIKCADGRLYGTGGVVSDALDVDESTLRSIYRDRREEFESNCVGSMHAIDFIRTHRTELSVKYVRGNMHLWSVPDMLAFALLGRSKSSLAFRREMINLVAEEAKKNAVTITREEYEELKQELAELRVRLQGTQPALIQAASAAGVALNAQKRIRHLHAVH